MNAAYLKFAGCVLLFALWTGLVVIGHADSDLIAAIKYALGSLGLYHAVTNLQAAQQTSLGVMAQQIVQQLQSKPSTEPPAVPLQRVS
jgi:branched-subunit amino acid transport protein